ncbi:sensor histidine kinase [Parapedobacter indicus]|uniref:histidine kinase n=1 Tax=Parapedobacter indicus TaxID=1477437 RepID=A0A1I3S4I8_9SPHI|nr:histidine kinase [Parapedobacter indicus]PPK99900.1 histidine kinase [Parapedobacter indicus]SFJ52416.1 Histidine kinase [Parapedobacter indicus]
MLAALGGYSQEYTITKLKLFPDRDEVLIKDVTTDSLGFIWFLTNGEIYRYDGYRSLDILKTIANQRLTDDMPQRMLIDHRNRLWMAGNANLSYLDLKTWRVYPVDSALLPPIQDRTVVWIRQLADSTVMVAYENGHLLVMAGDRFTRIDELYERGNVAKSRVSPRSAVYWKGKYWVGTTAGGLLSIDTANTTETQYHQLPGINRMVTNLIAQDDALLLDVFEQDIYRFEGHGMPTVFTPIRFALSKDKSYVLAAGDRMNIYADDESTCLLDADLGLLQRLAIPSTHRFNTTNVKIFGNEALLGTDEGIFVIYPKTKGLSQLIPTNPGANKSTRGIYVYPDGALFYGTYNGAGLIDVDGKALIFQELKHAYAMLPMNDNELLIGTEGGMLKVFNRKLRQVSDLQYTLSETASDQYVFNLPTYVMSLAETEDDYLIGSMSGLWLLDKQNHQLDKYPLESGEANALDVQIRHIRLLPDSSLLLSTHLGLYEVRKGVVTKRYPQSGNVGVFKSIVVGDTIWLATQGEGLLAIDAEGRVLQTITTKEGLSNNLVYSLEQVGGLQVVGTANGLNIVNNRRVRRIGIAEGLSQSEFNSGASFWDPTRKRVYVGGLMGYTVLDMNQPWFEDQNQLESYVTEIHTATGANGEKSADYTWPYRGERELVLQPGQSLTGLYVGTPGNHRADGEIRYSLNAGDWEPLELGQFISLIEPSPGDYRFQLETRSTAATGNQQTFTITKLPHYYETWWFNALVLLAVAGAIGGFFKYRETVLQKEKKMRIKIASDLHDEVGSSLTRIYFQADMLSSKHVGRADDKQLQQIADTSKQALLTMSDMVWSIDSRFDTIRDLVIRMKDYLFKLREELEITYRFDVRGDQTSRTVTQLVRQNLFLIFKEALTNAIKYSDGSEVTIDLNFGRTIQLTIRNRYASGNGPITDQQGGRGLESMRLRASRMGGELTYTAVGGVFSLDLVIP